MINSDFYNARNLVTVNGASFYPLRYLDKPVETEDHVVATGETMYSLSAKLFDGKEHFWTAISDINDNLQPEELVVGMTIKLPKVLIKATDIL